MEVKPGYKQTEVGLIPEDWNVTTIGSVAETSSEPRPPGLWPNATTETGTSHG